MKIKLYFLLLFFLAFISCSEDTFVKEVEENNDLNAIELFSNSINLYNAETTLRASQFNPRSASPVRPMKASTSGTLTFMPDGECYSGIREVVHGEGNATHLGKFTVHLEGCLGGLIDGVQIAANGDIIDTKLLYPGMDENGQFLVFGYEGGTGRFENVVGEIKLYITLTPDPDNPSILYFENYGEGWIAY